MNQLAKQSQWRIFVTEAYIEFTIITPGENSLMDTQSLYQRAIKFAAHKHAAQNQTIPGSNLPYAVHLANVAMEIMHAAAHTPDFDLNYAVQVALLHDVLEDTPTSFDEIAELFGLDIANGVQALTKNDALPKAEKMNDCLERIKAHQHETWAVKLADRITNMQVPPSSWDNSKKIEYRQEAMQILQQLKGGNAYLENRLREKIQAYGKYLFQKQHRLSESLA